jgi:DNA repair protein RecN (Recombination protein N)
VYVNQVPVPLSTLKRAGDLLIDLHGQHQHQSLLNPDSARELIDAHPDVSPVKQSYVIVHRDYVSAREALADHDTRAQALAERRDVIEFQLKELSSLGPRPGEDEELENELKLLTSVAERGECAGRIVRLLSEGDECIEHRAAQLRKQLRTLAKYDTTARQWLDDLDGALAVFTELDTFASRYLQDIDDRSDSSRIEAINDRLARIQRLRKKYGCTIEGLVERGKQLEDDLAALENRESDRAELEKAFAEARRRCDAEGEKLRKAREKAAAVFDRAVTKRIATLGFEGGAWETRFTPREEPGPHGFEECAFFVRTNPGEPALPLARCASGGEISRLMLAVKTEMAERDSIPVLIFDEIDAGIGGVLAGEIAKRLYELSKTHQVFCISHLHQIASLADHHCYVYKQTEGQRTITRARNLGGEEKVDEIARMLGGASEISRKHARELLNRS